MTLNFTGDLEGLENGISAVSQDLGFVWGGGCATGGGGCGGGATGGATADAVADALGSATACATESIAGGAAAGPAGGAARCVAVEVSRRASGASVRLAGGRAAIAYSERTHFFRALAMLANEIKKGSAEFSLDEQAAFATCGAMFDASRNAVMTVDSIKRLLRKMALMGLNMLMMYTEDTYEVEEYPYFGYMRGAYSYGELKECDDYAYDLGIEMIPCMQTLAHLSKALRWPFADSFRDTMSILMVGCEDSYKFIRAMLKAASAPFRSRRVHVGMDEAFSMGLGQYLKHNPYCPRDELFGRHIKRVREITDELGLRPMLWEGHECDCGGPFEHEADFTFWKYESADPAVYEQGIRRIKDARAGKAPMFAGSVIMSNSLAPDYTITFDATNAALPACKREGVKEVYATVWGDDGAENNEFLALLGLQLYAEHNYGDSPASELVRERFEISVGAPAGMFYATHIDRFRRPPRDEIPGFGYAARGSWPSKFILYQDILLGIFDKNLEGFDFGAYYRERAEEIERYMGAGAGAGVNTDAGADADASADAGAGSDTATGAGAGTVAGAGGEFRYLLDVSHKLCRVCEKKWDMGIRIKRAYDAGDRAELGRLIGSLKELDALVREMRAAHESAWMRTYKAFGWETLDARYGRLFARIDTAARRLGMHVGGELPRIEELEFERKYFDREHPCLNKDNAYLQGSNYPAIAGVDVAW